MVGVARRAAAVVTTDLDGAHGLLVCAQQFNPLE